MMKVFVVTNTFPPEVWGGATHTYEVAYYLHKLGVNVEVLAPYPKYPYGEFKRQWRPVHREIINEVRVTRLLSPQPHSPNPSFIARFLEYTGFPLHAAIRLSFSLVFKKKDNVIIFTSQPPDTVIVTGYLLKRVLGIKWVIDVRDLWQENAAALGLTSRKSVFFRLLSAVKKRAYQRVDLIAYTAETIKNRLQRDYNINGKLIFNPNGLDPDIFYPRDVKRGKNLVYLGNVGHAYELETVIKAFHYIDDPEVNLLIRGGGDRKPELQQFVNEHNLNGRVKFLPKLSREKLQRLLSSCLMGICPLKSVESLRSVIPIKVLEYMGAGIPFIACGQGEIETLAEESGAGIIVENDPTAFAQAINKLVGNHKLREEMGGEGREYVVRKFNKPKIIADLYKELIAIEDGERK